jgi:hypothetical protein
MWNSGAKRIQFLPWTEIKGLDINSYFRQAPLSCSSIISPGTYYPTAQSNYGMKILLITVYGTYVIATWWFRVSKFEFANDVLPYALVASLSYIGSVIDYKGMEFQWNWHYVRNQLTKRNIACLISTVCRMYLLDPNIHPETIYACIMRWR